MRNTENINNSWEKEIYQIAISADHAADVVRTIRKFISQELERVYQAGRGFHCKDRQETVRELREEIKKMRENYDLESKLGMGYNQAISEVQQLLEWLK